MKKLTEEQKQKLTPWVNRLEGFMTGIILMLVLGTFIQLRTMKK